MSGAAWAAAHRADRAARDQHAPARLVHGQGLRRRQGAGRPRLPPGRAAHLPRQRRERDSEQRWTTYAISLLAFSFASVVVLYAQLRLQGHLPFNPDHMKDVGPALSFNTVGQLPHQHELAELRRRVDDEPLHADGRTRGTQLRLRRGRRRRGRRPHPRPLRRRTHTLGNFWVDMTRTVIRVLLPLAIVFTLVLVSQGVVQNFHAAKTVTTVSGQTQTIPGRPDREPGGDQGPRAERRRPVQRQLRRIRTRTRTRSRTSSRSGCCSRSRSRSRGHSA